MNYCLHLPLQLAIQVKNDIAGDASEEEALLRAWTAFRLAETQGDIFGAHSFGFLAIEVMFEQMKAIENADRR